MFGYVKAIPSVLPEEEAKRYEGVYCGLCRALGERYGWRARLILNYDFVFLAMLLDQPGQEGEFPVCPCPIHPWKKKACCPRTRALETAADESVILTWWKLQDAIRDGDWKERTASRLACAGLRGAYRKASRLQPEFDRTVRACLEELQELEQANTPSLDRPADTFARILQGAAIRTQPAARHSATQQILYHVGRWIYLADAWDDLEKDRASGSYNPLLAKYGDEAPSQGENLRETMDVSLGLANTAFDLIDWGPWEPLLEHILRTGLPAVEESIFTKKNKPEGTETDPSGAP